MMVAAFLLAAAVRAQDANSASAAADAPYATIVARNMFGLLPIPPPHNPADDVPPPDPPPKITPNGIMTIFGKDQALFKVANKTKPGQPQKPDDSYVLAEGEMQDDITVVKINHLDGIITFNNHGTVQELPLVPAKDTGSGPAGGGPGGHSNPMIPSPGGGSRTFPGRTGTAFGSTPGNRGNIGNPNSGMGGATSGSMGFGGGTAENAANGLTTIGGTTVNANRVYQPVDNSGLTAEQEQMLIEAQRLKAMQTGNSRMAAVLPPTPFTEQNVNEFNKQQNGAGGGQ